MKIISFAWTTPALLAGVKTCTRREWSPRYAKSFYKGELVQAWDKLPRAKGKRVGTIRLTADPFLSNEYPDSDYTNEGLRWMERNRHLIQGVSPYQFWNQWRREPKDRWVVRFELVEPMPKAGTNA